MVHEPVFKKLPFYRVLTSAVNTTLLSPVQRQSTYLTREFFFSIPQKFKDNFYVNGREICSKNIEIQLRFCRRLSGLKSSHEIDDFIPPEIEVYLNCSIPDLPPFTDAQQKQRKARPIDITRGCTLSKQNQLTMSWFSSDKDNYEYFFTIHLVKRIPYEEIVKTMSSSLESDSRCLILKQLGVASDSNFPTNSDLAVTSLTVSLLCPLSMQRIKVPSRSIYCNHVQCFDVYNYLQINEFKPNWKCPVCRDKAPFDTLIIDKMFSKILEQKKENEIVFSPDGNWDCDSSSDIPVDVDSHVENDNDVSQQKTDDEKSVLTRPKLASARSSPRVQKRLNTNSPRTVSKSQNSSTPRRRKQTFSKSSPYITDVIEVMKNRSTSSDVVDLTIE